MQTLPDALHAQISPFGATQTSTPAD